MILPAIVTTSEGGVHVPLHDRKGEYLGSGFVDLDGSASLVIYGEVYRLVFQVTWAWHAA